MDKILLEISCPATSKKYDFWVSKKMNLGMAKERIISEIREYEKNESLFRTENQVTLFREDGEMLNQEALTMEQSGVNSGECLMLV